MKRWLFIVLLTGFVQCVCGQIPSDSAHLDYVTGTERAKFRIYLYDTVIDQALKAPLDSDGEYGYETACAASSQFMVQSNQLEAGFNTILRQYDSLQLSTKQAFFEAVYGLYPGVYKNDIRILITKETNPKFFAIEAAYLFENDPSPKDKVYLLTLLGQRFPQTKNEILLQLRDYLINHKTYVRSPVPDVTALFSNQKELNQKIIYSFQRWNRDYPGLAILQNTDGTFAKDSMGNLLVFRQLARSAGNLPYFITDGNTPQGIYNVTGVQVSSNHFLGPTPTIQMVMPFENGGAFWSDSYDDKKSALSNYLSLLPAEWRGYKPMTESFYAGKIGRSAIISHGTTLNPEYFLGKPYYPISPTLGCLCASEIWDTATGKLRQSEQLRLINAFTATPGIFGYVIVINLDDKQQPVTPAEVGELVKRYEARSVGH
jgi:hypothetical protein